MDLGLINHKLTNDEYEGREAFVEDLRLVFSNAVEFNRPAAQQAQSQKELNPHFVMDDLAAKTYAIATHLLNYVDHLELECFTVSKFKLYFNLRFVGVGVRCSSLYVEEGISRRSCSEISTRAFADQPKVQEAPAVAREALHIKLGVRRYIR